MRRLSGLGGTRAEALGYEGGWVQEQIVGDVPILEPVTLIAYAAALTSIGCIMDRGNLRSLCCRYCLSPHASEQQARGLLWPAHAKEVDEPPGRSGSTWPVRQEALLGEFQGRALDSIGQLERVVTRIRHY